MSTLLYLLLNYFIVFTKISKSDRKFLISENQQWSWDLYRGQNPVQPNNHGRSSHKKIKTNKTRHQCWWTLHPFVKDNKHTRTRTHRVKVIGWSHNVVILLLQLWLHTQCWVSTLGVNKLEQQCCGDWQHVTMHLHVLHKHTYTRAHTLCG